MDLLGVTVCQGLCCFFWLYNLISVLCSPVRGTEQYFIARRGETLSHRLEITIRKCQAYIFTEIDSSTVQLHLPAALDSITFDSSET